VTFSNVGDKNILIGWMSNWNYANNVPTDKWRSAMTVPRVLNLVAKNPTANSNNNATDYLLVSRPVEELKNAFAQITTKESVVPNRIELKDVKATDFDITFSNAFNEKLVVGYQADKKQFYVDRTKAGVSNFNAGFAAVAIAPRLSASMNMDLSILLDKTAIELFADSGRTVMTALFFPTHPFTNWKMNSKSTLSPTSMKIYSFK